MTAELTREQRDELRERATRYRYPLVYNDVLLALLDALDQAEEEQDTAASDNSDPNGLREGRDR